jgi:Transposase DDE domain
LEDSKKNRRQISGCYEVNVVASGDGTTATSIEWKAVEEKLSDKLTGSYFLRTNLTHLGAKDLWQLYNTLRRVENAFRFMKSSLGLRPVYHQLERRVDGHLWITVMAYHLIQQCLYQLKQKGIQYEWRTVRKIIRSRVRVTTQVKMEDGKTLYLRSSTKAEGEQLTLYRALDISPQILRTRKTVPLIVSHDRLKRMAIAFLDSPATKKAFLILLNSSILSTPDLTVEILFKSFFNR